MKKKVIVIGAGLGGLIAANVLAKCGHQTILYESHNAVGGYTSGFWRKGFYFESGTFSLEDASVLFSTLKELGIWEKISFIPQRIRLLSEVVDGIPTSYSELKKLFLSAFPQEKDSWEAFFAKMDGMFLAFSGRGVWNRFCSLMYILKYRSVSIERFAEKFFAKDSPSYVFVCSQAFGYPGSPAWMAALALVVMFHDYWAVAGGMQSLANALAENFQKNGGELRLRSCVEKIVTHKGSVKGVVCQGEFEDADAIIAACNPQEVFLNLLDDTAKIDISKIQRSEVSEAVFTVYLGLRLSNNELRRFMKSPYVSVQNHSVSEPFPCCYSLYSPSLINNELSPEGKSSLMIQAGLSPTQREIFSCATTYAERKKQMKEWLVHQASSLVPNLSSLIEVEDAATPLTYERFTHNPKGATSGWSWDVNKSFYKDVGSAHVCTKVKNFYIGSCWACRFGGIPGAVHAGLAAAKEAMS